MSSYQIEIDEEIWHFLKKNAEPFDDTPNSVLRRLLFPHQNHRKRGKINFPPGVSSAVAQILEMIYLVKECGCTRRDATQKIAKQRGISVQAVIDKYTRQLNKKAHEIDILLMENKLDSLQRIVKERFPRNAAYIREFFDVTLSNSD